MTQNQTAGARLLVDPTNENRPAHRAEQPRLAKLENATVGLLDISKARGDVFLDRIERDLTRRGARVLRFCKPTFSKIAPIDLRKEIRERCDAVIEALAD